MKAPRGENVCLVYSVPRTVHGTEQVFCIYSWRREKKIRHEVRRKRRKGRRELGKERKVRKTIGNN